MNASACHCGAAAFADFDRCAEHVSRRALVAEVVRLGAILSVVRAERPRHERDHAAPANRGETTILERM